MGELCALMRWKSTELSKLPGLITAGADRPRPSITGPQTSDWLVSGVVNRASKNARELPSG